METLLAFGQQGDVLSFAAYRENHSLFINSYG